MNNKTVRNTNVIYDGTGALLSDAQKNALKMMISNMATRPAMLRWEYKQGQIRWDCKELHNDMIDQGVAATRPFGQWAVDYYATCYRNISNDHFEYL